VTFDGRLSDCTKFDQACCIILDINLNDESGIEVRHQLRASGISLPVIFITGKDNDATRTAAMDSGCIAYLRKPFPASALIAPIEKASTSRAQFAGER
jgi:FixJ family two-component response regulator